MSISSKETTSQIKAEKQLSDLTDSLQLMSDKFDEYEKSRIPNGEPITKLQIQVTEITDKVGNLYVQVDEQEQYARRNCLLIHGVYENQNEDTDALSISILNDHLRLDIQPSDINQTHRIGNKIKALKKG